MSMPIMLGNGKSQKKVEKCYWAGGKKRLLTGCGKEMTAAEAKQYKHFSDCPFCKKPIEIV